MKLIDLLKNKRNKVLQLEEQAKDNEKTNIGNNKTNTDNIKIIIENSCGAFDNEEEIIKEGAIKFLELGRANDMEDAIITAATMIRGLKYARTEKDENGNIVIVFKDMILGDSNVRNNK